MFIAGMLLNYFLIFPFTFRFLGTYQVDSSVSNMGLYDKKRPKDVAFNKATNGLKTTHIGHNIDKGKGQYELTVQDIGYKNGNAVILDKEDHTKHGVKNTEGT